MIKNNKLTIAVLFSVLFLWVGIVQAAPSTTYLRTILPEVDSTYDVGSNSVRWANGYFDNLTSGTLTIDEFVLGDLLSTGCGKFGSTSTTTICGDNGTSVFRSKVGISTSTPWATLSIGTHNQSLSTPLFIIASSSSAVATTTHFIVTGAGNVGIGTTSPTSKFVVADGTYNGLTFDNPTSVNTSGVLTLQGYQAGAFDVTLQANGLRFHGGRAGITTNIHTADDLVFSTGNSSRMTINSSGNVGIGTTNPAVALNLFHGATTGFRLNNSANSNARVLDMGTNSSSDSQIRMYDNSENLEILLQTDDVSYFNSGNVGIGTTTPNNKLDIFSSTKSAIGFSGASDSTYKWTFGMDVSNGGRFSIASSTALGTTDRLVIDGNGNVGIGTTNPSNKLNVFGTIDTNTNSSMSAFRFFDTSASPVFKGGITWYDTGRVRFNTGSSVALDFTTNDTDTSRLWIATGGNVGIGTTTPTTQLQVTTSASNATSTLTVGKANQNKGSCLELFDAVGTAYYVSVVGGALQINTTSCK